MRVRVPPGIGLTGGVFQSGTPILVNDPRDFPECGARARDP